MHGEGLAARRAVGVAAVAAAVAVLSSGGGCGGGRPGGCGGDSGGGRAHVFVRRASTSSRGTPGDMAGTGPVGRGSH